MDPVTYQRPVYYYETDRMDCVHHSNYIRWFEEARIHLMEELRKISRVVEREYPEAALSALLVIDATTGQNGLAQAKVFGEVANLDGIILTKLDGTAKGGIAIAIRNELGLPVRYIGLGEKLDDMQPFDARAFVDALFG